MDEAAAAANGMVGGEKNPDYGAWRAMGIMTRCGPAPRESPATEAPPQCLTPSTLTHPPAWD